MKSNFINFITGALGHQSLGSGNRSTSKHWRGKAYGKGRRTWHKSNEKMIIDQKHQRYRRQQFSAEYYYLFTKITSINHSPHTRILLIGSSVSYHLTSQQGKEHTPLKNLSLLDYTFFVTTIGWPHHTSSYLFIM